MAKKAKIVKNKKKFPWDKVKYYLKTLVNNTTAMEAGMKHKWFVTLIVFILALGVSIIPQTVTASKTQGSQYVNSESNDAIAVGLYEYVNDTTSPDIKFIDGIALLDGDTTNKNLTPIYSFTKKDEYAHKDRTLIDIYYVDLSKDDTLYETTLDQIRRKNPTNTTDNLRTSSYLIFTKEYFESQLMKVDSGEKVSGVSGDYKNLRKEIKETSFKTYLKTLKEDETITPTTVIKNYYNVCDDFYINNRTRLTWVQFGIITGLNAGITLLMGLIIFLMTRGKNNPLKGKLKWYHGFGISSWMSISPAILSLILGFILPQFAMMMYILFFGMRCMWLSMKNLRPNYQEK